MPEPTVEAEILREGKAVSQVLGCIVQGGEPRLVALASFGGDRDSEVQVDALPAPEAKPVSQCKGLDYIEGITPEFIQQIEMCWAFGNLPFSGKGGRELGGWMQFRKTPETISDAHIIALVDAWPPAVLPYVKQQVKTSSLSWTLDIVHPRPFGEPGDWLIWLIAGYGGACVPRKPVPTHEPVDVQLWHSSNAGTDRGGLPGRC